MESGIVPLELLEVEVDRLMEIAKEFLETDVDAHLPTMPFMGRMQDDPPELALVVVEEMFLLEMGSTMFADFIQQITASGAIDCFVLISQAWALAYDADRIGDFEAMEAVTRATLAEFGSFDQHPNRREIVMIVAHTRTHDLIRQDVIERDAAGRVVTFNPGSRAVLSRDDGGRLIRSDLRPTIWGKRLSEADLAQETKRLGKSLFERE